MKELSAINLEELQDMETESPEEDEKEDSLLEELRQNLENAMMILTQLDETDDNYIDPVELEIKHFRDIPVSERRQHPKGDFAGSGMSFPIFKCDDVTAAFHALGLTNQNKDQVRSRIISIAQRKGFTSCLPESVKAEEFLRKLEERQSLTSFQEKILELPAKKN